jgi:hypothetical protein
MNSAVLLIITAVLTIAALVIAFFIGAEMLRLLHDLFAPPPVRGQYTQDSEAGTDSIARAGDRTRRNRATVERLITHFEDKDTRPVSGPKES